MIEANVDMSGRVLAVADVATLARLLYAKAPRGISFKQRLRPYICPFHVLLDYVPRGATLLDVGCGAGLFIALLASLGRIRSAIGFDTDGPAIRTAQDIAARLPNASQIRFEQRTAHQAWPDGQFNVVSVIDVMHHIPPNRQPALIVSAASHVADGGVLIYKDMAKRPLWRAWANRVHDLVAVQEWIHYVELRKIIEWAEAEGLSLECRGTVDMLWYRHEWCVFRRTATKPVSKPL
jgi:2-polyprenyl-3-methyl-5-hydroxy-6-metoxy-1,4-benzoquinol methylase